MSVSQPNSTDKLNSPDHSLMHRQIATDPSAPVKSLQVDSGGNVILLQPLAVAQGGTGSTASTAIGLGQWVSSSSANTVYQAETDGFVTAWATSGPSGSTVDGYTDASNPPTTQRAHCSGGSSSAGTTLGITMPVKKGNYWKVTGSGAINWLPLGS